jgi:hypothetical protein
MLKRARQIKSLSMMSIAAVLSLWTPLVCADDIPLKSDFGKKLWSSFEFIDVYDIAVNMANGYGNKPWEMYDEQGKAPLITRWQKATDPGTPIHSIIDLVKILGDDPSMDFRGHPILAGGDINKDNNGNGYYRITAKQRDALLANPYLVTEILPDPNTPTPDNPSFLGRHQYPSAATYTKFKDRLSPALQADLVAADQAGALKDITGDQFKTLTKRILKELSDAVDKSTLSPIERYHDRISIHVGADYNGRSTRANFKREAGHALFLTNFDLDLFSTPEDLAVLEKQGAAELAKIRSGLVRAETSNPGFPDFYRAPELWEVLEGYVPAPSDEPNFVKIEEGPFQDSLMREMIRTKSNDQVQQLLDCLRPVLVFKLKLMRAVP